MIGVVCSAVLEKALHSNIGIIFYMVKKIYGSVGCISIEKRKKGGERR